MYAKISGLDCEGRCVTGTICYVELLPAHVDSEELTPEGKAHVETFVGDDWRYQTVWVVEEVTPTYVPPVHEIVTPKEAKRLARNAKTRARYAKLKAEMYLSIDKYIDDYPLPD